MRDFGRRGIVIVLVAIAARTAAADAPPPAPASRDATIVGQPFVRDHRLAFSFGTRTLCLDVTSGSFCMGGVQFGFAFKYGDVHAGVMGNVLSQPNDGSLAPYGGLELGTRYYYVSQHNGAHPVALGLAFRGDLDLLGLYTFFRATPAFVYFAVANTYGANAQLLIGSRLGFVARAAVGWSDRVSEDPSVHSTSTPGFCVDVALSALARF